MSKITLEVCVDTLDDVLTAASAGAQRIELCSSLETGGLTPSIGMARNAASCGVPVFAMIRPRAGDFDYSKTDIECMLSDIEFFQEAGISGFVFGALNSKGDLDERNLAKLITACNGMPATLNRAFDLCRDPIESLEIAVRMGFDRILTSGASVTVSSGLPLLEKLFAMASDRIIIIPGGGVTPASVGKLLDNLPIREIHASCKRLIPAKPTSSSDVNVGRSDVQDRFATDPGILGELLSIINPASK
jgi:copper homeostasis protein